MDTAAIWCNLPMMFLSQPMAVQCPILRSSLASDFVKKLLVVDPDVRMTAPQALEHPWIKNHEDACSDCIDEAMVPRMKTRKSRSWRHLTTGRSWKILEDFQKSSGGWWNYFASCKYRLRIWRSLSRRYCLAETACQFCEKCFKFLPKVLFHWRADWWWFPQLSSKQCAWSLCSRFEVASLCDFAKSQSFRRSGWADETLADERRAEGSLILPVQIKKRNQWGGWS